MEYGIKPISIATSFVLVALLWTFPLQHVIAYPFVFLFFGAVMGSAWFGGVVAGFVAVVQSSLVITYFFIPPLFSITVAKESQSFLAAFILCAFAISIVSSARKRAENAVRVARDELEAKVRERTAELQRSNLEIRESERQLRILTEAIPQQIWRSDAAGCIEYCNQHLRNYVGERRASLEGESFFGVLHPEDEALFRQGWESALVAGGRFEVKVRVRGADDSYRWFLVRSIPQRSEDGTIARWYGIHIDIEEQHKAQQSLVIAQEDLSRLSRTLSMAEMAASIAHELNQPLTAVVTHAYACREWLGSNPANFEKASATAEKIVQESTRASAVVKRVRALFRKEGTEKLHINVNHLVQEIARLLRDESIRRGVAVRMLLDPDLPRIEADPVQIQQVLLNLANNAMDAMGAVVGSRELTIHSEKHGTGEVVITIEDNGPGIAPETATRIFEPFFSTKEQGTGMGLAICRSIVEAHDGRIWVENKRPTGARFKFTLGIGA
ncbi:ATP-binding protein [Telmatobacter sp. DSM 110680]|uniref:histidine kinase n=1 Tax=Telmatobacter sp. DSM 110680 TaxID=3036704 RepID=A0AAU7DPL3_9BACT